MPLSSSDSAFARLSQSAAVNYPSHDAAGGGDTAAENTRDNLADDAVENAGNDNTLAMENENRRDDEEALSNLIDVLPKDAAIFLKSAREVGIPMNVVRRAVSKYNRHTSNQPQQ